MSDAPFINVYTSDFLAGTGGMTAATKGVYITLLCMIYESEAPLSQSWDTLARRCGCTLPAFRKAMAALQDDGKIELIDGRVWSDKCEKHLTLRRERRNSAKAAAKKRWQKSDENQGEGDAPAYDPQCKPEPEPDTEIKKEQPNGCFKKKRGSRLPEDWALPRAWGEWAVSEGWPEGQVRDEAEKFKDYWISATGQKATKMDWLATWRNWMRNCGKPRVVKGGTFEETGVLSSEERLEAMRNA